MPDRFKALEQLITHLPAIQAPVAYGTYENGFWWVKFSINTQHEKAWLVTQWLAYAVNYLSISERLSTVFYPVSPLPENAIDSQKNLSWIIECTAEDFMPGELVVWLKNRLPETW